ncbi:hypothetical protein FB451DRAFT_1407402 [Mycena latifolia]|nr:hypothetical protein FB451DRAFT_1407402 [Mycena latifolia]
MSASTPLLPPDADAPRTPGGPPRAQANPTLGRCEARLPLLACAVSVLALLLNFVLYLRSPSPSSPSSSFSASSTSSAALRFPDPYPGLGSASLPSSPSTPIFRPEPIPNFPTVLAHVDATSPSRVFLEEPNWIGSFGTIYGMERTFKVGGGISTLAQFRTIDWGMETCVLTLALNTSSLSASSTALEVYALDTFLPLDPRTLSWQTRPARTRRVGSLALTSSAEAASGQKEASASPSASSVEGDAPAANDRRAEGSVKLESPSFPCPARTPLTFEVVCSSPEEGCKMEFEQSNRDTQLGTFLPPSFLRPSFPLRPSLPESERFLFPTLVLPCLSFFLSPDAPPRLRAYSPILPVHPFSLEDRPSYLPPHLSYFLHLEEGGTLTS